MTIPLAARSPARFSLKLSSLSALAAVMLAITVVGSFSLWTGKHYWLMHIVAVQTIVYTIAAFVVSRRSSAPTTTSHPVTTRPAMTSRRTLVMVLAAAAAMRLVIVTAPPVSTDIYRYIWDGRTQSHGINPYAYVPYEVALYPQRDLEIYPKINRRDWLKTPYPPAAQMVFLLATRLGESVTVVKLAMVLFECLTIWGLLRLMRARGVGDARILLYAWNPLVIWEFAGSGHTEAIGIAFMVLAMLAADAGKLFLSGLALGAAALSKFFPLASAPAVYQRWDWRMPAGMVLAIAVLYAPYVGEGLGALGSVGDYAHEVGADTGKAFFLLDWLEQIWPLPPLATKLYMVAGASALLLAGGLVVMRSERRRSAPVAALVLITALQLVISPHYPWYFTWAVPFLCFRTSYAVIWLTGTASLLYEFFTPLGPALYAAVWAPFFLLALVDIFLSRAGPSAPQLATEPAAASA